MRRFDYQFLKEMKFSSANLNQIAGIQAQSRMMELAAQEYAGEFSDLRKAALIQSARASNAIEGIFTTRERIGPVVEGSVPPENHAEMEIAGYRDALNLIHLRYQKMDFRTEDILMLHRTIMASSGDTSAGEYKKFDNVILETMQTGERRVRFVPVPASETEQAMKQLELAYVEARGDSEINNLLLIPCVILDFLCIHPFADGNGRVSRLLSLLLLYKFGFFVGRYVSFENVIQEHLYGYYEVLRQSSQGWTEGKNDYLPFMRDFLSTTFQCYREFQYEFGKAQRRRLKTRLQIEEHLSKTSASVSEICKRQPDLTPETVEAALIEMFREGNLTKIEK